MAKRAFDLLFAFAGLLVLSPLLLVVGLAVRLSSPGPVIFRSRRVGRNGREFDLFKYRTMAKDAPQSGPAITFGRDPRITSLGAFLRRTKIDELPQLLNVVLGQMSLVGPRPEVPQYVRLYTTEQRAVLDLMPGITDPASVKYARESELLGEAEDPEAHYAQQVMPDKIRLNLEYAVRANVWTDFLLILKTLARITRR
jgi:lipopolysaccharide/colanic/teichoic acid biosynthesis glycosyltransferase